MNSYDCIQSDKSVSGSANIKGPQRDYNEENQLELSVSAISKEKSYYNCKQNDGPFAQSTGLFVHNYIPSGDNSPFSSQSQRSLSDCTSDKEIHTTAQDSPAIVDESRLFFFFQRFHANNRLRHRPSRRGTKF